MIGEVNAVTGMYIRALGVHLWNPGIAAVWSAGLFKWSECVRISGDEHVMVNVFNQVADLACKPRLQCLPK